MIPYPSKEYLIKALKYLNEDDARLVQLRFGLLTDKPPMRIVDIAQMFNISEKEMKVKLRDAEGKALGKARELEDTNK